MGSLVVKLERELVDQIKNSSHYSDIDMVGTGKVYDGSVRMLYDVEAVKQSIRNILMWRVGENVLRPDFGHNIHRSMYSQMDEFNKSKVIEEIQRAIEDNEPRAKIYGISLIPDDMETNTLKVQVVYSVIGNEQVGNQIVEQFNIEGK